MLRVLITDDDDALMGLYRCVMRAHADVDITYARSVDEASAALAKGPFDVALCDLNLGPRGGEGLDLLAKIRAGAPTTITFMMSTMRDTVTLERCRAARGFIPKGDGFLPAFRQRVKDALAEARRLHPAA